MEEQNCEKKHYFLDIREEVCPMTFVKTKLMLERLPAGAVLEVLLKGTEPLHNVPRSVEEMGHAITELTPVENGSHRLIITVRGT